MAQYFIAPLVFYNSMLYTKRTYTHLSSLKFNIYSRLPTTKHKINNYYIDMKKYTMSIRNDITTPTSKICRHKNQLKHFLQQRAVETNYTLEFEIPTRI